MKKETMTELKKAALEYFKPKIKVEGDIIEITIGDRVARGPVPKDPHNCPALWNNLLGSLTKERLTINEGGQYVFVGIYKGGVILSGPTTKPIAPNTRYDARLNGGWHSCQSTIGKLYVDGNIVPDGTLVGALFI